VSKVLVVDDRAVNREVLTSLLGYKGFEVVEASDGQEALQRAKDVRPQLIISDILMPTMDGFEFIRLLRADPAIAGTPVIFCTAHYLEREATAMAAQVGVTSIVYKPIDPEKLLPEIDRVLSQQGTTNPTFDERELDRAHLQLLTDKLADRVKLLRNSNAKLSVLFETMQQLGASSSTKHLLENVCSSARNVFAARFAAAALVSADDRSYSDFVTSGLSIARLREDTRVDSDTLVSDVMSDRAVRRVGPDRSAPLDEGNTGIPSLPPVDSLLIVPITCSGNVYGWFCVAGKIGLTEFDADDEALAVHLGALVGCFLENARLYRESQAVVDALRAEMTERQRAEAERAAVREQLYRAQKLESLGTLAGGIAHDINNMLVPIRTMTGMVLDKLADDVPERRQLMLVEEAAKRIEDLVRRLLAIGRHEDAEMKVVHLDEIVDDVQRLLRPTMPGVSIICRRPKEPAPIIGSANLIHQVLTNMAINSVHAAGSHPLSITFGLSSTRQSSAFTTLCGVLPAGEYWCLSVEDNGRGMDQATKARIFEPFFTTKPAGQGSGLGLSLARSIAVEHHGGIRVESEPGVGTKFEIFLPAAPIHADA
jgi:signal transduction histidine kinase/CheY-like chemotaxis protein